MLEPALVDSAELRPGVCFICGCLGGPLIDAKKNDIHGAYDGGRVYVCVERCLSVWARKAGWIAPEEAVELSELAQQYAEKVNELQAELVIERAPESKVLSLDAALELAKVIDLSGERKKRRPEKVGA